MGKADQIRKIKENDDNGQTAFQQNNTLDILMGPKNQPVPIQNEVNIPRRATQVVGNAKELTKITLRLEPYLYDEIKMLSAIEQRSINTMIAVAIKAYVTDPDNEKKINIYRRIRD